MFAKLLIGGNWQGSDIRYDHYVQKDIIRSGPNGDYFTKCPERLVF